MKTLDIIVPVYNEEDCIDKTLERLLNLKETFRSKLKVNFIFINDGSKDSSAQILAKYAKEDR